MKVLVLCAVHSLIHIMIYFFWCFATSFETHSFSFALFTIRRWDETHQECVYRKCAEQCPNGDINPGGEVNGVTMFEYQAKLYERRWYCCNDRPLCNSKRAYSYCQHFNARLCFKHHAPNTFWPWITRRYPSMRTLVNGQNLYLTLMARLLKQTGSRSTVGFNRSAIMVVVAIAACFLSFSSSWLYWVPPISLKIALDRASGEIRVRIVVISSYLRTQ